MEKCRKILLGVHTTRRDMKATNRESGIGHSIGDSRGSIERCPAKMLESSCGLGVVEEGEGEG